LPVVITLAGVLNNLEDFGNQPEISTAASGGRFPVRNK
jgi:hypothetical protein